MDVKINSRFVIAEREKRAWSQQHLADASGLALRTIQRIEATGTASYESAKSMAACFGVAMADLRASDELEQKPFWRSRAVKVIGSVVGASLLAWVAILFFGRALAQQVLLVDVDVTREDKVVVEVKKVGKDVRNFRTQLLLKNGEEKSLPVKGEFNLVIAPHLLDDNKVLLSVKLYEYHDHDAELIAEPRVIVLDGEEGHVLFSIGKNPNENPKRTYRVAIKPQAIKQKI